MNRTAALLVGLYLLVCAASAPAQAVVYVDQRATGKNNGTSWIDAFTDLQAALKSVTRGEIWVAAGAYAPSKSDRNASFALKSGVAIYGGFAGGEARRAERDPARNATVLTGDLKGDDGPGWTNMADNSLHVVTADGTDSTAVLDGLTVTAGRAIQTSGGGVFLQNASATFVDCGIAGNLGYQSYGAGIMLHGSGSLTLTRCSVKGNTMSYGRGGGMAIGQGTSAALTACTFEGNRTTGAGSTAGYGGAIYCDLQSRLTASASTFVGNVAEHVMGGSGYPSAGGAIESLADSLTLERCAFIGNRSHDGGAIYTYRGTTLRSCLFNRNQAVKKYDLGGNGGAMVVAARVGVVDVSGCTFYGNTATEDAGGLLVTQGSTVRASDSIFWENRDTFNKVGESQVKGVKPRFTCIQNMLVPRPGENPPQASNFPGCIDQDPGFVDVDGPDDIPGTPDDDFRLAAASSPCLDAADPASTPSGLDRDGNPRVLDGDLNGGMRMDMGAHERTNVRLAVSVASRPGAYDVEIVTTGRSGLLVLLAIGSPGAELSLAPLGSIFVDLTRPFTLLPLGLVPTRTPISIPASVVPPGGLDFALQAAAFGGVGGNVSNPVRLRIP